MSGRYERVNTLSVGVQNGSPANIYYIVRYVEDVELKILYENDSFELMCIVRSVQIRRKTTTKPIEVRVVTSMGSVTV